jgi:hypothetical protein
MPEGFEPDKKWLWSRLLIVVRMPFEGRKPDARKLNSGHPYILLYERNDGKCEADEAVTIAFKCGEESWGESLDAVGEVWGRCLQRFLAKPSR